MRISLGIVTFCLALLVTLVGCGGGYSTPDGGEFDPPVQDGGTATETDGGTQRMVGVELFIFCDVDCANIRLGISGNGQAMQLPAPLYFMVIKRNPTVVVWHSTDPIRVIDWKHGFNGPREGYFAKIPCEVPYQEDLVDVGVYIDRDGDGEPNNADWMAWYTNARLQVDFANNPPQKPLDI